MRALLYREYGSPDMLHISEIEKPTPQAHEVLIKVRAAAINSWDWDLLRGDPINRLIFGGFRKPKLLILGCDVAGIVEAVGSDVTHVQPGDAVFGDLSGSGWGAFADYVCAAESAVTRKPETMSFEQAAALPQAGLLALQGLDDRLRVRPDSKVLINGAGGGVGTVGIQIAKQLGAEVTGVDSAAKLETMRAVGADHVIDYETTDFTKAGKCYDLILDNVARRPLRDYRRALTPTGRFVIVGGALTTILQAATLGTWFSKTSDQQLGLLIHQPNQGMARLIELFEAGHVRPIIDRTFELAEGAEAFRYFGQGTYCGKVVILVQGERA